MSVVVGVVVVVVVAGPVLCICCPGSDPYTLHNYNDCTKFVIKTYLGSVINITHYSVLTLKQSTARAHEK